MLLEDVYGHFGHLDEAITFFFFFSYIGYSLWTRNNWKKQKEFRYLDMAAGMWQFTLVKLWVHV